MLWLDTVKVGMKFPNETKLYKFLGYDNCIGDSKKAIKKEVTRYIKFELTGKISRGKATNEIMISEIYSSAKEKEDMRKGNGKELCFGAFSTPISHILSLLPSGSSYSQGQLFMHVLDIDYETMVITHNDKVINRYKYELKRQFDAKIKTSINGMTKKYVDNFICYDSCARVYMNKEEDNSDCYIIGGKEKYLLAKIKQFKDNKKKELLEELEISWYEFSHYRGEEYIKYCKGLNSDVSKLLRCDYVFKVLYIEENTIDRDEKLNFAIHIESDRKELKNLFDEKMSNWIDKLKSDKDKQIATSFHETLFEH